MQGGVEAGVVINQRHQEGVSVQGALAGEVAKTPVNGSITNHEEMASIGPAPVKRGDIQVIKWQNLAES